MASKKKVEKKIEETNIPVENIEKEAMNEIVKEKPKKEVKKEENTPKYKIGSIVSITKDASTDLNGFKLFPQYKKYTYTVEAYDAISGVYSLRRLNLSLKLKEADIVAPGERAGDAIGRKQF